jgi:hypothetical protein
VRTPADRIDFGEDGYRTESGEPIFVVFPKSLTEGHINTFQKLQAADPPADDASEADKENWQMAANRRANCFLFDLVTEWNVDDDAGNTKPLMKSYDPDTQEAERFGLLSSMPLHFILTLVKKVTSNAEVPDRTADFSNGS